GNSIYSPNLYACYYNHFERPSVDTVVQMYNTMFKNIFPGDVASKANYIGLCMPNKTHEIYPGGSIHVPINVIDMNGSLTYEILTVIPVEKRNFLKKLNWWFLDYQGSFIIKGKKKCNTVNLTIHTTDVTTLNNESILLFGIFHNRKRLLR
uniref:Uncharacterized protein n=1 Tax=Amphimedon queenslandica TaxID=400682 RepID=A0A1X7V405_AMPQE